MDNGYIGLRSLTYAQRAARYLTGAGVSATAARAPWTDAGCAWSVRLRARDRERGMELLRRAGFETGRVWPPGRDGSRETEP